MTIPQAPTGMVEMAVAAAAAIILTVRLVQRREHPATMAVVLPFYVLLVLALGVVS